MPNYIVTSPDGKKFKVTAPDGASQDEILSYAQKQFASPKPLTATNPGEYDPASKDFQAKYGPVSGSNFENFRAAYGKAVTGLGAGIKQAVQTYGPAMVGGVPDFASDAAGRIKQDAVKERDAPLMRTKAGIAGNITGNVVTALPTMFVPGVNTYTGAAALGGSLGALQPVGTEDSRAVNTGLGAAGGVAGKYVGGKIGDWAARVRDSMKGSAERQAAEAAAQVAAQATSGGAGANAGVSGSINATLRNPGASMGSVGEDASAGLTGMQRQISQRGQQIGMKMTPGQASGSKALQQMEAKLESQPMTSGPFNAIKENNARVLSREAAASIGEASETVDSAVLDNAHTRIGKVFDNAADDIARPIDPKVFMQKFGEVQTELQGVSQGFSNNKVIEMLIGHAENGSATGAQLQAITSKLGKAAYKEMTSPSGDRELGGGLYKMKYYVDDLLQSGMSESRQKAFAEARKQYRNLMLLTSRVGVLNPSTGNVNGVSLANLLQQKDKAGFLRGGNNSGMYTAARFAQAFKPIVGDSGTATRSPIPGITELALRIPFNIAAKAYTSPLSIRLAASAGAASRAAGNGARNLLGTAPYYAPFVLPGQAGLLGSQLGQQ